MDFIISSGITSDGIILNGNSMTVMNGGTANNTTVKNFGSVLISKGGIVNSTFVDNRSRGNSAHLQVKGTANDTVLSGGTLFISSGGVANNTILSFYADPQIGSACVVGKIIVFSGGTANNTEIKGIWNDYFTNLPGGIMEISGGVASSTSVGSGARLKVYRNSIVSDTFVGGYAKLYGANNDDDVYSGTMEVFANGTASHVTVNYGGRLNVSGGNVFGIVENGGYVKATPGDSVTFASHSFSGLLLSSPVPGGTDGISASLHSGTTAADITIMDGGFLKIYSGGKLTGKISNLGGSVSASEGAIVDFDLTRTTPGAVALLYDLSGIEGKPSFTITAGANQTEGVYTLATGASGFDGTITVTNPAGEELGSLTVGGTSDISGVGYTLALSDSLLTLKIGEMEAPSPYTSDGLILNGETAEIPYGEVYHDTLICSGGTLTLRENGGTADGVTLLPGGSLFARKGTALNVVESGGYVEVQNGADVTFTPNSFCNAYIMQDEKATLHSGTTACNLKLAGELFIYDGGVADVVEPLHAYRPPHNSFGITVFSGGAANSVNLINGWCVMNVSSGGVANDTIITSYSFADNHGGRLIIKSGGTANNTVIERGDGSIIVSRGGVANGAMVNAGGIMSVDNGGTAVNIIENGGFVSVGKDANVSFASNTIRGLVLSSGMSATVHAGTIAEDVSVKESASFIAFSGGTANNAGIGFKGFMYVSSGAVVNGTIISSGGSMIISSGGMENGTIISSGGSMIISSGGTGNGTTVSGGANMTISKGGVENSATLTNGGRLNVRGTVNNTNVDYYGRLIVYSGVANGTTVNSKGSMSVDYGSAVNATVSSGGSLTVSGGGKLTGQMTFLNGAVVSATTDSILNFDLTQTSAEAPALLNNLSVIQGTPVYTLTVDGTQAEGNYRVADGASSFDKTISVVNTEGDELGTLAVGGKISVDELDYTLNLTDGTLSVEVVSSVVPVPDRTFFAGDFDGAGKALLAVESDEKVIMIYSDGAEWGNGLALEDGWEIAGVGDFNGSGADDFLRVNAEGYVVGEMSNKNGSFTAQVLNLKSAGWDILGTGDFDGNGADDVLIANPTAASETVGLLGYWKGGTEWTLINGYSAEWECVVTGDFNADGKCDMLWRNSFTGDGGGTYNAYCTWIVDPPSGQSDWRMVSVADPAEWNFLCAGDFDGDKTNDIAMINGEGVVGIWGVDDGYLSSWSILSAVDMSTWSPAGVADFNADGTDDIAWCNMDTGLVGCWQIKGLELADWQTLATIA